MSSQKLGRNPLGCNVVLSEEALKHILSKYSEMRDNLSELTNVVTNPDKVIEEDSRGARVAIKHFGSKSIVVVYKICYQGAGKVLTAYKTTSPHKLQKRGTIVWKKERST